MTFLTPKKLMLQKGLEPYILYMASIVLAFQTTGLKYTYQKTVKEIMFASMRLSIDRHAGRNETPCSTRWIVSLIEESFDVINKYLHLL